MPVGLWPRWVRLSSAWGWRTPTRRAARLRQFALAEHNSWIELVRAAEVTDDPARAAAYLRHADDEARHTRMFQQRARELDPTLAPWVRADGMHLFDRLGEARFLAFVAHGEARAVAQFTALIDTCEALGDPRTASVFRAVLQDEHRHAAYSAALVDDLCAPGDRAGVQRAAWRWEMTQLWRRLTASFAERLYGLVMGLVSLTFWPLAWWVRWARPARDGFQGRP